MVMYKYGNAAQIFDLKGKNALITGGSRGIGREMAVCLLENGCNVTIASRSAAIDDELCLAVKASGGKVFARACDVVSSAQVDSLVEAVAAEMGSIDILINSAGMNIRQFVWDVDDESWDRVITTNLTSTLYLISGCFADLLTASAICTRSGLRYCPARPIRVVFFFPALS